MAVSIASPCCLNIASYLASSIVVQMRMQPHKFVHALLAMFHSASKGEQYYITCSQIMNAITHKRSYCTNKSFIGEEKLS